MKCKNKHRKTPDIETFYDRIKGIITFYSEFNPIGESLRIALTYIIIGLAWILLSDRILYGIPLDDELISIISIVKGWIYVLITGFLLFVLILKSHNKVRSINQVLRRNYEELTITDQALHEEIKKLADSEERYRLVSEATNDGIWDEKQGERHFSERWYKMTGYSKADIVDVGDWMSLIHPEDIDNVRQTLLWHKQNRDPNYSCEYRLRFKNGQYRWILSKSILIFDGDGEIIRSAGSHTNITDLKESHERLEELAYKDLLTNLPNRMSFYDAVLEHILEWPDKKKALIFFDIDNFKHINDTSGHIMGDQLIIGIGKRLTELMDNNKSAYRNSGDEFVIFIHEYEDIEEIEIFAEELIKCISAPYNLSSHTLNITVSIGIALYPMHGKDVDSLFKNADMAMYKSKSQDRGRYTFYHESIKHVIKERMLLGNELRGALDRNEFELYYQPQIDINMGKIYKFEALLRWKSDKLGPVSPLRFIEVAEETHLINPIGDWVIEKACSFLKEIHRHGYPDISISVNVSIIQLMQQDFTDKLIETLKHYRIDPKYIELEVTESVLIESYEDIANELERLKAKGLSIALDDFGTGYSSLSYLARMPIDTIKIDKSFIDPIVMGTGDSSLVNMIIMLGDQLGMSVVAEGVETKEQLEYLKRHKCHRIQGYYFSKPLPGVEVLDLLDREKGGLIEL